ncbi:MAG: hypothetical protein SH868_12095 [Bythopirellula sp.]|nr:hypothetical protein [Bythopirellula sp.]
METNASNISDLGPEQRAAAEKLLGRSLANFQKIAIKALEGGNDIIVRFFGSAREKNELPNQDQYSGWAVPACFQVLTDLSDVEQADYEAVLSQPVTLSRVF